MKTIALTILLALTGVSLMAQDNESDQNNESQPIKTLLDNHGSCGVSIGFTSGYSTIDNKDAYLGGISLGLVSNHQLTVGIAGRAFGCSSTFDNIIDGKEAYLAGGYGGFYVEPILNPNEVIHITLPCIAGVGGAAYAEHHHVDWENDEWDNDDHRDYTLDSDAFFVLEPGIQIEMNVTRWMRVGVGASHRWFYGLDLRNTKEDMLDGFSTNFTLKLGKF